MYFNKRIQRSGALFESTFKARHIDRDEYARYITKYVHFNPYALFQTKSGIELMNALISYPWSTLSDYVGEKSNFSHIVDSGFRDNVLDMDDNEYRKYCLEVLKDGDFQT